MCSVCCHRESQPCCPPAQMNEPSRNSPRWMTAYLASACLCASAFCAPPEAFAANTNECERDHVSEYVSPDSHWVARVYGEMCDLGISSSSAVVVDLIRPGSSGPATTVLGMSRPHDQNRWPRPKWESPKVLAITLPASSDVALQMASFQHIQIKVSYCPADPEARAEWDGYRAAYHKWIQDTAAWIEASKRDPNTAGPKPAQPVVPAQAESTC